MNLGNLIKDSVLKFGEYEMFHDEGKWYCNTEVLQMANKLGNALKGMGVKKGDRVATQLTNCIEIMVTFFAVYRIGAIMVPMNPMLRPDQISYIYKDTGAAVTVTNSMFLPWVREAQKMAPSLKQIILVDKQDEPGTLFFGNLLNSGGEDLTAADMDNDDVAVLIYTSGTTGGNPKGAMLSHYALWVNAMAMWENSLKAMPATLRHKERSFDPAAWKQKEREFWVTSLDRMATNLAILPLCHIYGIIIMNFIMLVGGTMVIVRRWDAGEVLKTIEKFHIGFLTLVPVMYIMLMSHPDFDKTDFSSLLACQCGAAPMDPVMGAKWYEKTGRHVQNGYGLTECGGAATSIVPPYDVKYDSVGVNVYSCNRLKIFDNNDNELPAGQEGEIVIKGPTNMKGYWNKPEETALALVNGWLHTGDLGYVDKDGFYYVTGRKKDLIIRGGENVSPMEVEEVVCKHPKVVEAGCVGYADPVYGEEIKAFVVLKQGESCTEAEVIEFSKKYLPTFKQPKKVQFIDAIPKNMLGKMLRAELRKLG